MLKKILVCDDAKEILEVIEIILREEDYNVCSVSDCINIIEEISEFNPDLILLDLWIKNCDGREVAKIIKANKDTAETPILFISALNELEKIASDSNVDGYIRKPFEISDLLNKVKETLDSKSKL